MGTVGAFTRSPVNGVRLPVSGGGVVIPTAPGYIATVSSAAYAAYGAQRVISGYSGPLFQLRRASDAATMDVSPQTGGDYPDYAAVASWIGASSATVSTVYDQTGNGRNLAQATSANQPSFDLTQKIGNVVPILIDGYGRSSSGGLPQPVIAKTLTVGGLSLDLVSNSIFMTVGDKAGYNSNAYIQGTDDTVTTGVQELFHASGNLSVRSAGSVESGNNQAVPTNVNTIGLTNSATAVNFYARGAVRSLGHTRSSTAIPRLTVGSSIAGGSAYNGMFRLFGMVVYNATLNSTDAPAVIASMDTAFAKPSAYDYAVLATGDSIKEGSGGLLLRNDPSWMLEGVIKRVELFNTAIHGQTLATDYATRTKAAALFRTGVTNVAFIEAGTNDLGASTTGSNLYTNSTTPYITYLKGLGYKVVICTILPRTGSSGWTAAMETERGNYNALVTANSAGADYVLDLTQNPTMGNATNTSDTSLWTDKLHPTALGYRYLAGAPSGTYASQYTYYYALQQVLGATP